MTYHHPQGPTFRFFYLGCLLFIPSLIATCMQVWMTIPFMLLGFWLLVSPEAVVFDLKSRRYKRGLSMGAFVSGYWKDYSSVSHVFLYKVFETNRMGVRSISTTIRTRSYEIYLGERPKIKLREVTDYKEAKIILADMGRKFDLPIRDLYGEALERAKAKRG